MGHSRPRSDLLPCVCVCVFITKAFQVAEEKLGIPALLDAEDMVALKVPDRLSVLTYVSQYYNYFNGRPPSENAVAIGNGTKTVPGANLPALFPQWEESKDRQTTSAWRQRGRRTSRWRPEPLSRNPPPRLGYRPPLTLRPPRSVLEKPGLFGILGRCGDVYQTLVLLSQTAELPENATRTGTLTSRCAACRSHVHLVQRHFVEGKLYHRSCFT